MLRELHVRNLAVLAAASVELEGGLNVLSGETGAGKSLVVDSLSLLAGSRASAEMIRSGADALTVTGCFEPAGERWKDVLVEAGLEVEGPEILIRREIQRSGRNRVFLNDQPTTLRALADLAPLLLRIHGQQEELGLTAPELQRQWLDRSGGPEAAKRLGLVAERWQTYRSVASRLSSLLGDQTARLQHLELLRFQVGEIDAVAPQAGEDEELRLERDQLRHGEAIRVALGNAVALLEDDEDAAAARLVRSSAGLDAIVEWEPEVAAWRTELDELRIRTEELARSIQRRLDQIEDDPVRLDAVEGRLIQLERLNRKYGGSSAAVVEFRRRIGEEIDGAALSTADREALEQEVAKSLEAYRVAAAQLSEGRQAWGLALARKIEIEIRDLGLDKARLEVRLERLEKSGSPLHVDGIGVEFGAHGWDEVVFYFAPNPGEEAQPLARIASGGELSRLYLGLQLALGTPSGERPTFVFDEVDSGVGGAEAAALGKKLRRLADKGVQILAVTHLPQVAASGHHQLRVAKQIAEGRTRTTVLGLAMDERVEEIARMLAGEAVTDLARSNARALLDEAAGVSG